MIVRWRAPRARSMVASTLSSVAAMARCPGTGGRPTRTLPTLERLDPGRVLAKDERWKCSCPLGPLRNIARKSRSFRWLSVTCASCWLTCGSRSASPQRRPLVRHRGHAPASRSTAAEARDAVVLAIVAPGRSAIRLRRDDRLVAKRSGRGLSLVARVGAVHRQRRVAQVEAAGPDRSAGVTGLRDAAVHAMDELATMASASSTRSP